MVLALRRLIVQAGGRVENGGTGWRCIDGEEKRNQERQRRLHADRHDRELKANLAEEPGSHRASITAASSTSNTLYRAARKKATAQCLAKAATIRVKSQRLLGLPLSLDG